MQIRDFSDQKFKDKDEQIQAVPEQRFFFLLLVKGLVDDRKKVDFLKSPLIRQLTLEFGWQSAV